MDFNNSFISLFLFSIFITLLSLFTNKNSETKKHSETLLDKINKGISKINNIQKLPYIYQKGIYFR